MRGQQQDIDTRPLFKASITMDVILHADDLQDAIRNTPDALREEVKANAEDDTISFEIVEVMSSSQITDKFWMTGIPWNGTTNHDVRTVLRAQSRLRKEDDNG